MKRQRIHFLLILTCATTLAVACGGGGGGGGGVMPTPLSVTLTPDSPANQVNLAAVAISGADFTVQIRVNGALDNLFGIAARLTLPANVSLIGGSTSSGSILLTDSPAGTSFSATQSGNQVFITATRISPSDGSYDDGVDIAGGGSSLIYSVRLRANAATTGNLAFPVANREVRTCSDGTETCDANAGVGWSGATVVAN